MIGMKDQLNKHDLPDHPLFDYIEYAGPTNPNLELAPEPSSKPEPEAEPDPERTSAPTLFLSPATVHLTMD